MTSSSKNRPSDHQEYHFSLINLVHAIALLLMLFSVANSLRAFMRLEMAVMLAGVLTYLFSELTNALLSPVTGKVARLAAFPVVILLATLTVGMSASTLWSMMFAQTSVAQKFGRDRESVERQLMQTLAQADSAQANLTAWDKDATDKATFEKSDGGSCSKRADVKGARGPVFYFRMDDAKVASTLKSELEQWRSALKAELDHLKAMPKAEDFSAVRTTLTQANKALDAALPLAKDGAFSSGAIRSLNTRKSAMISTDSDGVGSECGDQGRLELIERAITALNTLANTTVRAHMAAAVNLEKPEDITVRGWLRAANITASLFHVGGSFNDDPLWREAVEANGLWNRESLPFLMAIVLEASVVLTKIWMRIQGSGRVPFASRVVESVQMWEDSESDTQSLKRRLAQAVAKLWCNIFYVKNTIDGGGRVVLPGIHEPADNVLDSGVKPVRLGDNPLYASKVKDWASELLPYYQAWGPAKLLIIPLTPETKRQQAIARHLADHKQLSHQSSTVKADQLHDHPTAFQALDQKLGANWRQFPVGVYRLGEQFGRYMDMIEASAIGPVVVEHGVQS